jgi:ERCC4-type nuclease
MLIKYTGKDYKPPAAELTGAGRVLGQPDDPMIIRVDTREQVPLEFNSPCILVNRATVPVFDYSIDGDQDSFSVERKSLPDFVQAVVLSKSWIRELAKIKKAQDRLLPIIYIAEFSFEDIGSYDYAQFYSGRVHPQFVYRRVAEMIYEYGASILFAGNREMAAYAVALILKRRKESL